MQTGVSASFANRPPFAGISFEIGEPDSQVQRGFHTSGCARASAIGVQAATSMQAVKCTASNRIHECPVNSSSSIASIAT
jgi:hypothetical protein